MSLPNPQPPEISANHRRQIDRKMTVFAGLVRPQSHTRIAHGARCPLTADPTGNAGAITQVGQKKKNAAGMMKATGETVIWPDGSADGALRFANRRSR
jgi:hypothetical protein